MEKRSYSVCDSKNKQSNVKTHKANNKFTGMKATYLFQIISFSGLLLLASCQGEKSVDQQTEAKDAAVKVSVSNTSLQTVNESVTYTANVEAEVVNQIIPTSPGRIEKIFVKIGDKVSKGQLLVQMESTNLTQQKTQLANLEKDYERFLELLTVGGVAQQQVDQLKVQVDVARTALNNLEENTSLRSPVSGVITARNYDPGDVYSQDPILVVEQLNPLKAIIFASESYYNRLKVGMAVDISLDVYGEERFIGKISRIYPTVDAATHTFGVEVAIENRDMKIRPGMYSRVTLNLGDYQSIVVPDAAVQKQAGSNDRYVFVVENGVAKYRKVELGQRLDKNYEIRSGIAPGEVVVTAGQARLIEGTKVEILNNN